MRFEDATILIADDEPELLEIFALWLRRAGCTVLTAVNGEEALQRLRLNRVDMLVSDIRMPIMDGVALVRRLYELGLHIPSIIFVSGFGDIDPREVYALGVEAMLPKPLSRQQFLKSVESCLKDQDELWLEPATGIAGQSVDIGFESLQAATAACTFALGRGGCCFQIEKTLGEDQPVRLAIHFAAEDRRLDAEGIVRWFRVKEKTGRMTEFT